MGRFSVDIEITNHEDVMLLRRGLIEAADVRRVTIPGVVDTGAVRLVLPLATVRELGLPETGEVKVRYADARRATRKVVGDADVAFGGRTGTFSAIVEPRRTEALIGAIVLEELDFVVDCVAQKLVPRDPNTVISELGW